MGKITGQDIISGYQNEKKKKKLTGLDILNGYETSKKSGYFQESKGNALQTVGGSVTDIVTNAGAGLLGMGETILDTMAYLGPMYEQAQFYTNGGGYNLELSKMQENAFREQQKAVTEFIKQDLYDEKEIAKALISDNVKSLTGIDSETMSVFGDKSDSIAASGGQLLGQIGASVINPYAGLAVIGASAFGGEVDNAFNNGATFEEAGASGAITAGGEVLSEKLFGFFGAKGMDKIINKTLANKLSNSVLRTLAKIGVDASGEGAEEILSGITSAIGQKLTYMNEKEINELFTSEDALDSFIGGAVLGSFGGSVDAAKTAITGKDMVTGLTKNEDAVVEEIVRERMEENKAGLGQVTSDKDTKKQLEKYREEAREMLKKGEVSVDVIEKALGGDALTKYNDSVSKLEEYNKLNRIETGKLTGEQTDRLAELKEQVKAGTLSEDGNLKLKQQLSEQVSKLTENDQYIRESYNEKAKRSQAFEADLSQYEEKAQATIQKAIDSGILNNTKKTHAFVDMIAKISADKGVVFDFSNSQKIKESGFALNGKTINGYVQGNNITLNINSAKALNKVVGHEITHVLEGTDLYNELQNVIIDYAKSKGDYDARVESLTELYKDIKDADINAELTADLVGEYLFSDPDFVNRLSTEQLSLFKKIYDEIKYLVKTATAGSKEAKQLLEVQRAFEKAYRESSANVNKDARFSIGQINGKKKNYGVGVVLDTNIFNGIKPRNWSETVKDYVYDNLAGTELTVYNDGVEETLYLAKKNERVQKNGAKNSRKVIDKLARNRSGDNVRNLSVVHIDELAETSTFREDSTEHIHQWLDENGWEYRTAYAMDKNGKIYEMNLNIAKSRDGRKILYDINNIKEIDHGVVASKGLAHKNQSHKNSISQSVEKTTEKAKLSVSDSQGRELSLEERLSADTLLDAQDLIAEIENIAEVSENGYVTVYHRTTEENAKRIRETGKMSAKEDGIFFSTQKNGEYTDGYGDEVVEFKIPVEKFVLDDIFDTEAHLRIPLKNRNQILDVSGYLVPETKLSISDVSEDLTPVTPNQTYGKDIELITPDKIAPVQEDVEEVNTPLPENTTPDLNLPLPDTYPTKPVETVKERNAAKLRELNHKVETERKLQKETHNNFNKQIAEIQSAMDKVEELRKDAVADFKKKTYALQTEYDAKENKTTKAANELLTKIERLNAKQKEVGA